MQLFLKDKREWDKFTKNPPKKTVNKTSTSCISIVFLFILFSFIDFKYFTKSLSK